MLKKNLIIFSFFVELIILKLKFMRCSFNLSIFEDAENYVIGELMVEENFELLNVEYQACHVENYNSVCKKLGYSGTFSEFLQCNQSQGYLKTFKIKKKKKKRFNFFE